MAAGTGAPTPNPNGAVDGEDDELTIDSAINDLEAYLKIKRKKGKGDVKGERWERFVAFYLRWIYESPGRGSTRHNVRGGFDTEFSEVLWTGKSWDGDVDIKCRQYSKPTGHVVVQCKNYADQGSVPKNFLDGMESRMNTHQHGDRRYHTCIAAVYPRIANRSDANAQLAVLNQRFCDDNRKQFWRSKSGGLPIGTASCPNYELS